MSSDALALVENAAWPALLVDSSGAVRRVNRAAVEVFGSGLSSANANLSTILTPDNTATPEQFLADCQLSPTPGVPIQCKDKSGKLIPFLASICSVTTGKQNQFLMQLFPERALAASQARSSSGETTMIHRQKLECALQLARTVSLDFNNALTSILGHTSLVLTRMEPDNPFRASLIEVEKSAARAAEIANDLGAFSRAEKEVRLQANGNLNLLLQRSVQILQESLGATQSITWHWQLERDLFLARIEEAKMQQVFIKILENAIEAVGDFGSITVQTRNIQLSEPARDCNIRLDPGSYVYVEISDSGCGIKPELLPRIFEPFFTTKGQPKHRGLGLAWVYGVVTNHGGRVALSSQPGAGTSVRAYLPAEQGIIKHSDTSTTNLRGDETVLIVDDEALLLTMGQTILSGYGYEVLTANSGQRALEILEKQPGAIDLVITDLVMPGMSGRELVERLKQLDSTLRILCTSGCVWNSTQDLNQAFLQKPFTAQELLMNVKRALA